MDDWNPFEVVEDAWSAAKGAVSDIVENPIKAAVDVATMVALGPTGGSVAAVKGKGQGATAGATQFVGEGITKTEEAFGAETKEQKQTRVARETAESETAARSAAYNDALSDAGLDAVSRQEIKQMYGSGANSQNIASYLQGARSGKGVFGVRKINEEQAKAQARAPGRRATLGSGGII